jgi:ADP-ribose pyrophosphatase
MKKISEENLFSGNWLSIKETEYENSNGESFKWESVERKNNSTSVVIIPKLVHSDRFVLIRQFRPAINGYILGFPAGLDNNSDEEIIEELKEETGFTGIIKNKSFLIKSGSGIINDAGKVIFMEIDEYAKVNKNPKQNLETSEQIEVIVLHKNKISDFLTQVVKEGDSVGANLWYLFIGSQWIFNNEDKE